MFSRSYSGTSTLQLGELTTLDALPQLPLNTVLILAGTLHGIHAITNRLTPGSGGGGLEAFEAENWGGKVFLTATGTSLSLSCRQDPRDAGDRRKIWGLE